MSSASPIVSRRRVTSEYAGDPNSETMVQRCVIIQKDDKGYGLTVSGDNPVFVQSVRNQGAAAKAGVQEGDRIIKVNGTLVTKSNHIEVVKLIKSGSYVALTLLGKPQGQTSGGSRPTSMPPISQPIMNDSKDIEQGKLNIMRKMMEQQRLDVSEMQRSASESDKLQAETAKLERLEREVQLLESHQTDSAVGGIELEAKGGATVSPGPVGAGGESDVDGGPRSGSPNTHARVRSMPDEEFRKSNPMDGTPDNSVKRTQSEHTKKHPLQPVDTSSSLSDAARAAGRTGNSEEERPASDSSVSSPATPNPVTSETTDDSQKMADPKSIITADDFSTDDEAPQDHGPFSDLQQLMTKPAHTTIFLRFVLSNHDPSPLFFYLVCDLYGRMGNSKDVKKWAYEIFSTFLADGAPLKVVCVPDKDVATMSTLLGGSKEDVLRPLFNVAARIAETQVRALLSDFQTKRALGLGNFYGDSELNDHMERQQEAEVVVKLVSEHLSSAMPTASKDYTVSNLEWNQEVDRSKAIVSCLATFAKQWARVDCSSSFQEFDKIPLFCGKELKKKSIPFKGKKSQQRRNHQLFTHNYQTVVDCCVCGRLIWGIGYQGYRCQSCTKDYHVHCAMGERLPECSLPKKGGKNMKTFFGSSGSKDTRPASASVVTVPPQFAHAVQTSDPATVPVLEDNRPPVAVTPVSAANPETKDIPANLVTSSIARIEPRPTVVHPPELSDSERRASTQRSSSFKHTSFSRRKEADPKRFISDPKQEDMSFHLPGSFGSPSTCSVNSNSSRSLSPSQSQEAVDEPSGLDNDSDMDIPAELPALSDVIDAKKMKQMKPKEKERQKVINELFYTEQSHVRALKIMEGLFHKPMTNHMPDDFVRIIFPNLPELIRLHCAFSQAMQLRRRNKEPVQDVADILLERFTGKAGDEFQLASAIFSRGQSFALDLLRARQRRDQTLSKLLADIESSPYCNRLSLKDFLPKVMMRLTKYPLLISQLIKHTPSGSEEHDNLQKALVVAKKILDYVNQATRDCEDARRLVELQRKMDDSSIKKSQHPMLEPYKNFNLKDHKLIYEGPLTWKISRQKTVEVQAVLLEQLLVLLQRDDNKVILKMHSLSLGSDDTKFHLLPFIRLDGLLVKAVATDPQAFFLVCTGSKTAKSVGAQIYELQAHTKEEKKKWFKYIQDATEAHKKKDRAPRDRKTLASRSPDDISSMPLPPPPTIDDVPEPPTPSVDASQGQAHLIQPGEVVVETTVSETARPVLSHREQVRRVDQKLMETIIERERLAGGKKSEQEPQDLVLTAIRQFEMIRRSFSPTTLRKEAAREGGPASQPPPASSPPAAENVSDVCDQLADKLSKILSVVSRAEEERTNLREALSSSEQQLNTLRTQQTLLVAKTSASPASRRRDRPAEEVVVRAEEGSLHQTLMTTGLDEESPATSLVSPPLPATGPPQEIVVSGAQRQVLHIEAAQPLHLATIVQETDHQLETVTAADTDDEESESDEEDSSASESGEESDTEASDEESGTEGEAEEEEVHAEEIEVTVDCEELDTPTSASRPPEVFSDACEEQPPTVVVGVDSDDGSEGEKRN